MVDDEIVFSCLACGHENTVMDGRTAQVLTQFVNRIKFGDETQRAWFDLARDSFVNTGEVPHFHASEIERCCELVVSHGLSTGHADTISDLVQEVVGQYVELSTRYQQLRNQLVGLGEEPADGKGT